MPQRLSVPVKRRLRLALCLQMQTMEMMLTQGRSMTLRGSIKITGEDGDGGRREDRPERDVARDGDDDDEEHQRTEGDYGNQRKEDAESSSDPLAATEA